MTDDEYEDEAEEEQNEVIFNIAEDHGLDTEQAEEVLNIVEEYGVDIEDAVMIQEEL